MRIQLQKKVAVVTGASKGIGKAIAIDFGREGAYVVVNFNTDPEGAVEAVAAIKASGQDELQFRLTRARSRFVTGSVFVVDGGFTAYSRV